MPSFQACSIPAPMSFCSSDLSCDLDNMCEIESCDVDQAIISVGESEGEYDEIKNYSIERDPSYPVRVTLQYYKATSNGIISPKVVEEIAIQMVTARSFASKD